MVLAAGLPSVVIPQLFDQVWHGMRQQELGIGVLVRRATPRAIRAAVEAVVMNTSSRRRAETLARAIGTEDGSSAAADEVEAFLVRHH